MPGAVGSTGQIVLGLVGACSTFILQLDSYSMLLDICLVRGYSHIT